MSLSLFALLDDIATILDDVGVMTKLAAKKTAGVLGDDLALNAQQVSGVKADRELPVVWAVAKGSLINKAILVPAALLISAFAPFLIMPLLIIGGLFLCFEGVEKLAHRFLHSKEEDAARHEENVKNNADESVNLVDAEKDKIKGAIRTDFVLSAEIIVIALGVAAGHALTTQIGVLLGIAVLMTVGVYGVVALIVKIDDLGFYLCRKTNAVARTVGNALLSFAPWLMKALTIVGTLAMFLVGGGLITHNLGFLHHLVEAITAVGGIVGALAPSLFNAVVGLIAGSLVLGVVAVVERVRR
jgi:predicted DNA repair protein MutK